ncbi:MAG: NAD(P)-dependent oxidoreductase [Acetobacter sp.]
MKILVAGASGALGQPLIARLRAAGHDVWGMAQSARGVAAVNALGAGVVQGNALDRSAVFAIMERVRPDCVVDQLTSLPASPFDLPQRLPADRVLRLQGGGNLFDAARACGVGRYIQQSCGFYLDGAGGLGDDTALLKVAAPGHIGESARMYAALEKRVMSAPDMQGTALRYGFFYGPHTWYWPDGAFTAHMRAGEVAQIGAGRSVFSFIHVQDAAEATVAALTAPGGVYNVVDDQPIPVHAWLPAYARWVGAPPPGHMAEQNARELLGEESVYYQNGLDGARNHKARSVLGLAPRRQPWGDE